MSRERLHEHFSELFEGTIDPGLGQQIKTRFDGDYDLQADYQGFAETMSILETMKDEQIETPQNLSSMIADRIEAGAKKPALSLGAFWRNFGLGTLACVAIAGAFLSIKNRNHSTTVDASMGGLTVEAPVKTLDMIEVKMVAGKPHLNYNSSGPKTVRIINESDQKVLKKYTLDNSTLSDTLENPGVEASVLQIEATGESAKHLIVLPGTGKDFEAVGKGDIVAFAKLLATKYGTVVHLQMPKDTVGDFKWDVTQADANDAAKTVLSSSEYTITGANGILVIQKQSH